MTVSKRQLRMEACSHLRTDIVAPGTRISWLPDGTQKLVAKLRCPDCGAWWIEEKLNGVRQ